MPPAAKPRHRSGYSREETEQVEMVCLTIVATLGAHLDDLCVVGGLVPLLLIDYELDPGETEEDRHPGTNDFDVGLAIAILDDGRYAELSERLRREGFGPDKNDKGNDVRQRWRLGDLKVTIDFLIPPAPGQSVDRRVQDLEPDFAALVTRGLEFAFDERSTIELEGRTVKGEKLKRTVPVCGPAAFVVLKALAFADRIEHKDAYDLVYVIRRFPGGAEAIAERLGEHASRDGGLIESALKALQNDFGEVDSIGPRRAAEFDGDAKDDLDPAAADAHGHVDDLLKACRVRGLLP
jgi:Nucleotidyl transferase AbiEii toxin, Type IV TA system